MDSETIEDFFGVYLLFCVNPKYKGRTYIGFTVDPNRRIKQHNRGVKAGGAYRTSKKGPWDMVLIVHGFPNDISALRFEWAWQNPRKSRRLCHIPCKKSKEPSFEYCLRVLSEMLITKPWSRLPLTLRWLKQEYCRDFKAGMEPPIHMPVAFGLVKPIKAKSNDDAITQVVQCCFLCDLDLKKEDRIKCLSPSCSMESHILCLSKYMLGQDSQDIIPMEGNCPKCNLTLLWGDLVRLKKGCYQNLEDISEESGHWVDTLSQLG